MINWFEPTQEQKATWRERLRALPPQLQRLGELYPPWRLFKDPSGCRVYVSSIREDGTVRVVATTGLNVALEQDDDYVVSTSTLTECEPDDLIQTKAANDP